MKKRKIMESRLCCPNCSIGCDIPQIRTHDVIDCEWSLNVGDKLISVNRMHMKCQDCGNEFLTEDQREDFAMEMMIYSVACQRNEKPCLSFDLAEQLKSVPDSYLGARASNDA